MISFHNGGHIKSSGKSYREKVTENKNPSDTVSILENVKVVKTISIVQDNPNTYSGPAIPQPPERQTLTYKASTDPRCESKEGCECVEYKAYCIPTPSGNACFFLSGEDATENYPGATGHDTMEDCILDCESKWYCIRSPEEPDESFEPFCIKLHPTNSSVADLTPHDTEEECAEECSQRYYCVFNTLDEEYACELKHTDDPEVSGLTPYITLSDCSEACGKKYYCVFDTLDEEYACQLKDMTDPAVSGLTPYTTLSGCSEACQRKYYCLFNDDTENPGYECSLRFVTDPEVSGLTGYDTNLECSEVCAVKYYCLLNEETQNYECVQKLGIDPDVEGLTGYNTQQECEVACYYNQSQYFNIIP